MHKYPDLVKQRKVQGPEQVSVADITYLRVGNDYGYLHLLTDAYSKKMLCRRKFLSKTQRTATNTKIVLRLCIYLSASRKWRDRLREIKMCRREQNAEVSDTTAAK